MVPVSFAFVIFGATIAFGCLAGALVGVATCLLLKLRWSGRTILQDAFVSCVTMILGVVLVTFYNARHGTAYGGASLLILMGSSAPLLREIARSVLITLRQRPHG